MIGIEGRLWIRKHTDKQSKNYNITEIKAENIIILDAKKKEGIQTKQLSNGNNDFPYPEEFTNDDLPF